MCQAGRLESFKRLDVLFEILDVVRVGVNAAELEQRFELEPRHPQQLARFEVRQSAGPVALDRECFKRVLARVRSLRDIARQFDRDPHGRRVAESAAGRRSRSHDRPKVSRMSQVTEGDHLGECLSARAQAEGDTVLEP